MEAKDRIRLEHIKGCAEKIQRWLKGVSKDAFWRNDLLQAAVMRELEVIGEAAKGISDALRQKHPEVPWREMAGMRDVLIHEYFEVDLEEVWTTATEDIPELHRLVSKILSEPRMRL